MTVAVVLPALNEADTLPRTLESIRNQSRPADRLVVVDGGSADGTAGIAERFGVEVLVVPGRGRGGQIAAGVAACHEDVVVVAHADMILSPLALETIPTHLRRHPACPGGCLGHQFDDPRWHFRAIEWWDRRRAMRGHSYGDQAQFIRRVLIGEFPDMPLMEDVELARRLRRLGRPAYLNLPVTVSARRYHRLGWIRVTWVNWQLRRAYEQSGPQAAARLFRRYYGVADRFSCAETGDKS